MKIDWQTVTLNIRNSGLPLTRAGKVVHMDEQTINRLARGEIKEPRFSQGLMLLDLHLERCPDKHTPGVITK